MNWRDYIKRDNDLDILDQLTDQLFQISDYAQAQKWVQEAYDKQQNLQ